jgi:23S rRNA pseudouridine1911/1915/1917 synthase
MTGDNTENCSERIRITAAVAAQHGGARLDQVAAELFSDFSRARLQKWIRSGQLTVNGQKAKPTYKVTMGETLLLDAEAEQEGRVSPQDIPLDLIHADDDILVVNKPAGMVVHPAAGNPDGTLQNALLFFDPAMDSLPRSGIVHRLDKDTSGVMVVARSLRAHTALVRQLQERTMSRVYRAVALGDLVAGGRVDAPIGRHPVDRKRMAVVPSGRPAVTHYRVLERFGGATYLEVSLETGRTHQIRVHMAKLGHPLAGDPQYGRRKPAKAGLSDEQWSALDSFPRQALHAMRLVLQHPANGEVMRFEAPLPEDFLGLLQTLQGGSQGAGE